MKPRTTPIARSARIRQKPRTAGEQRAKFDREYGGQARHDWVEDQPCIVCGRWPSVNAHVVKDDQKGTSRKAGYRCIVPLCDPHHTEQHKGTQTFARKYGVDLAAFAADTEARWQEHRASLAFPLADPACGPEVTL